MEFKKTTISWTEREIWNQNIIFAVSELTEADKTGQSINNWHTMKKILFIIGSLREGSFNRKLAEEAERLLDGRAFIGFISA